MKRLMDQRMKLQNEVRSLVKKYGEMYNASNWKRTKANSASSDNLTGLLDATAPTVSKEDQKKA
jgi:hypothetical protein